MSRGRQALATLVALFVVTSAIVAAASAKSTATPRPHDLRIFVNGKRQPGTKLVGGQDDYVPIANGKVNVVARWRTNARGTGYRVVVATTEPVEQTYAACSAGRSCRVSKATISPGLEMTWKVTIVKTRGNRVVGGLLVCLVGRS